NEERSVEGSSSALRLLQRIVRRLTLQEPVLTPCKTIQLRMATAVAGNEIAKATRASAQSQHTTLIRQRLVRDSRSTRSAAIQLLNIPRLPNSTAMALAAPAEARVRGFSGVAIGPRVALAIAAIPATKAGMHSQTAKRGSAVQPWAPSTSRSHVV